YAAVERIAAGFCTGPFSRRLQFNHERSRDRAIGRRPLARTTVCMTSSAGGSVEHRSETAVRNRRSARRCPHGVEQRLTENNLCGGGLKDGRSATLGLTAQPDQARGAEPDYALDPPAIL